MENTNKDLQDNAKTTAATDAPAEKADPLIDEGSQPEDKAPKAKTESPTPKKEGADDKKKEDNQQPTDNQPQSKEQTGEEALAAMITACESLPKTWRESFAKRFLAVVGTGGNPTQTYAKLRDEFRHTLVSNHEKAAAIVEVLDTERREGREYKVWLSLAANTSGFAPKDRERLAAAALAGNRDEFMSILHEVVLNEQADWQKIDQGLS